MNKIVGHTIGALDIISKESQGVFKAHCRTCNRDVLIMRAYLKSDRAIMGCRDCSRQKNHLPRGGKSKEASYRQWHYLIQKWQKCLIDIPPAWAHSQTGFEAYMRDKSKEKKR